MSAATVDYGDGSGPVPLTLIPPTQFALAQFTLAHTYASAGTYTMTITLTDVYGSVATATATLTVAPNSGGFGTGGGDPVITAPPVMVTSIRMTTAKRLITGFTIDFDGPVTGAGNPQNYHLALVMKKKVRKHVVAVIKPIAVKSVSYDPSLEAVTITPAGKLAPGKINELSVTASGIVDLDGQPLDGNHDGRPGGDLIADVGKRTVSIR